MSESTVSYLVHLFLPGLGWAFYFPLAYGFMMGAYCQTRKATVVICCALLSAAIKLLNLPMVARLDYVINPAVAIVLEGLAVSVAFRWLRKSENPWTKFCILPLAAGAGWRFLYLLYLLAAPLWIQAVSVLFDIHGLVKFVTLELLGNTILIALYLLLYGHFQKQLSMHHNIKKSSQFGYVNGITAIGAAGLAVVFQWLM